MQVCNNRYVYAAQSEVHSEYCAYPYSKSVYTAYGTSWGDNQVIGWKSAVQVQRPVYPFLNSLWKTAVRVYWIRDHIFGSEAVGNSFGRHLFGKLLVSEA